MNRDKGPLLFRTEGPVDAYFQLNGPSEEDNNNSEYWYPTIFSQPLGGFTDEEMERIAHSFTKAVEFIWEFRKKQEAQRLKEQEKRLYGKADELFIKIRCNAILSPHEQKRIKEILREELA